MARIFYKLPPLFLLFALICAPGVFAASGADALSPAQFTLFNKANEFFEQSDYKGIAALLQAEVEERDNPHPYGCILYGVAHMRMDDNKKAISVFRKGLAVSPEYVALHLNLGVALLQEERFEQAGDCFLKAHALEPQASAAPTYAYSAAQCFYFAKQYSRSLETVKKVLAQPAVKPDWVNLAAVNCMQLGKWSDAEGYLLTLVEMEPEKRRNWKSLAYARLRLNRHNMAAAALDIAARLPEASERDRRELSGMYRYAQAPILGLEVEKLLPPSQEQEKVYISSLLRANRQAQLIDYIDGLIAKKPQPELYLIKGMAHYRLGELKSAQRAFSAGALIKGKETDRCNLLAGMVAWENRDWQAAKNSFSQLTNDKSGFKHQAAQAISAIEAMEEVEAEIAEMDKKLASHAEGTPVSRRGQDATQNHYAGI